VGVGVGVGVGVRVGELDPVPDTEAVGDRLVVGDAEGDRDPEGDTLGLAVTEGVSDPVTEGEGLGEGVGQSCASLTLSSPIGPSSSDPRMADMDTHATAGSQLMMPGLGVPSTLLASWVGMVE
jgi:hypothetical protein